MSDRWRIARHLPAGSTHRPIPGRRFPEGGSRLLPARRSADRSCSRPADLGGPRFDEYRRVCPKLSRGLQFCRSGEASRVYSPGPPSIHNRTPSIGSIERISIRGAGADVSPATMTPGRVSAAPSSRTARPARRQRVGRAAACGWTDCGLRRWFIAAKSK
jgi:hypothetical protein